MGNGQGGTESSGSAVKTPADSSRPARHTFVEVFFMVALYLVGWIMRAGVVVLPIVWLVLLPDSLNFLTSALFFTPTVVFFFMSRILVNIADSVRSSAPDAQ